MGSGRQKKKGQPGNPKRTLLTALYIHVYVFMTAKYTNKKI